MEVIKRRVLICVRNKCNKCASSVSRIPDTCKFDILHALENKSGIQEKPRRSGKTTELVRIANELSSFSYKVYYITRNQVMCELVRSSGLWPEVKTFSLNQLKVGHAKGFEPGYVVADEIQENELWLLHRELKGCPVVAAYYTSF